MSKDAWNKVLEIHPEFKKITTPIKEHLGIDFGYMIVFNDGRYFQIIENLECLQKWVTNVETSNIFCARNVTTYFDDPYNFTIWPEEPTCSAMEIYKEYDMWNGITVSKVNKDSTELYWFTRKNAEDGWHKWFIRNKSVLSKFINYFNMNKNSIYLQGNNENQELYRLDKGFDTSFPRSEYVDEEAQDVNRFINLLNIDQSLLEHIKTKTNLSPREIEVLILIGQGYPLKVTAQKLMISASTVKYHLEHIRIKTKCHKKVELISLYQSYYI